MPEFLVLGATVTSTCAQCKRTARKVLFAKKEKCDRRCHFVSLTYMLCYGLPFCEFLNKISVEKGEKKWGRGFSWSVLKMLKEKEENKHLCPETYKVNWMLQTHCTIFLV